MSEFGGNFKVLDVVRAKTDVDHNPHIKGIVAGKSPIVPSSKEMLLHLLIKSRRRGVWYRVNFADVFCQRIGKVRQAPAAGSSVPWPPTTR